MRLSHLIIKGDDIFFKGSKVAVIENAKGLWTCKSLDKMCSSLEMNFNKRRSGFEENLNSFTFCEGCGTRYQEDTLGYCYICHPDKKPKQEEWVNVEIEYIDPITDQKARIETCVLKEEEEAFYKEHRDNIAHQKRQIKKEEEEGKKYAVAQVVPTPKRELTYTELLEQQERKINQDFEDLIKNAK